MIEPKWKNPDFTFKKKALLKIIHRSVKKLLLEIANNKNLKELQFIEDFHNTVLKGVKVHNENLIWFRFHISLRKNKNFRIYLTVNRNEEFKSIILKNIDEKYDELQIKERFDSYYKAVLQGKEEEVGFVDQQITKIRLC